MTLIRFAKQQQEQNMGKNQTQTTLRQGETTIKVRKEISTLIVLKIGEEKETPISKSETFAIRSHKKFRVAY